jgi:acyl carrier protein
MTKSDETVKIIRDYVFQHFHLARQRSIGDHDPLLESGVVDSLGVLDLVGFLEQTFGIALDDEDLTPDNFQSIASLAEFVAARANHVPCNGGKE